MTHAPDPTPNTSSQPSRPKQRITPRALLDVKRLSDPQIHPDGQHVAFVVEEADFEDSRFVSHLWLTEWLLPEEAEEGEESSEETPEGEQAEGAEEPDDPTRQLTFSHDGECAPRWSPDGRYLAFLSERIDPTQPIDEDEDDAPTLQLWVLPIDGGEARRLTSAKEGVLDYAWTPDSAALVFLAPEPRPKPIESLRKEDRDRHKIDPTVEEEDRLRRQFWRVEVEEKKPKWLYTGDLGIEMFELAPEGERLCFVTNYTGDWNDYHRDDLWVLDLADRQAVKLTDRPGGKTHLRWSPDGAQIAFLSWRDPNLSFSLQTLFVIDVPKALPAPHEPRILLPDYDYDLTDLEWSQEDGALYALAAVRTGSELICIRDGVATRLETGDAAYRQDLGLDPGASAAVYVQESANALPEIYLRDEQGEIHPLTKLNAEFAETYRLPRQEVIAWTSADGMPVEGVLTYPLDHVEGKPCPLIVQIHGGPKSCAQNTLQSYSMPAVWSAEGYAVLRPNYRGSEGYGNAFAIANRRDLGGGDYQDILAGVDRCLESGIADPTRLGVMGGSYGGYMTNWIIGHTDRFAAAISMFGIFHLQTDYSNSELPRWDTEYLGAYYWEDPEIYRRLSPGAYLDKIQTPTLILHGDEDNNTFISNSKELYQALRQRGVTTQFVHYPREGHGLGEPNHKLDEMRRCLAWMDRYVRHRGQNPTVYRVGDKFPHPEGELELVITHAEIASFLGQPAAKEPESLHAPVYLEVVFTLSSVDTRRKSAPITLALSDIRLEEAEKAAGENVLTPIGIPLDLHGGKVLVEGDNMHVTQHPDTETGQLGFAFGVVFRVPQHGNALLRVADFAAVAVHWTAEEEDTFPN